MGTDGLGLTVILKVPAGPAHPLILGTTLMVEMIGDVVELANVNDGMLLPEPDPPRPMPVASLVQV